MCLYICTVDWSSATNDVELGMFRCDRSERCDNAVHVQFPYIIAIKNVCMEVSTILELTYLRRNFTLALAWGNGTNKNLSNRHVSAMAGSMIPNRIGSCFVVLQIISLWMLGGM